MENASAAPTGCYKCGLPGHWSRDCPASNPNSSPTHLTNSNSFRSFPFKPPNNHYNNNRTNRSNIVAEKLKKVARSRPKLTPELLLRDEEGLGFVLRHFPCNFKYRGRGHEVSDLGNLIGLYSEWHSRLLPYYSFDQFVHKVEQTAATKRVKMCIRDLRERVARGVNPTKLSESPAEHVDPTFEKDLSTPAEAISPEGLNHMGDTFSENHDVDVMQEDMLQEICDKATKEPKSSKSDLELPNQNNGVSCSSEDLITKEQRARMEANRLKALERAAAARARLFQSL